ncbi:asparaginase [Ornithinibacillus bavariensis]|uniref:asparaginase n=1 Tax=Ornithinibacillus bavariensis TaxID=545502 RepID=A0A919X9T1_9BACI|nr:asparaginase [Ornithinibacillus bavariensis]GIO28474.1 L-asparaginase [Ornithinibacillus bavariensis]HAM81201.1 L-asparaginase [Ornithinibacillus sp.]
MKKIMIVHTGGTISMLENKETGEVNITGGEHPLANIPYNFGDDVTIDEYNAYSLPSPHITPQHMLSLAKTVENLLLEFDGIVITHGTDTLEETAYFLDLVLDTEKPVIITGAMRSSNEIGSDALYNLISSIRVTLSPDAYSKGVLVVMNDEIHSAINVTKTSTSNIATFQSPQYGPLGIITKESIIFHHQLVSRTTYPVDNISKNVFLLKAYAGMDSQIFDSIHHGRPDGIVVEALGQGNLPKETLPAIKRILADQIPIVLVSRSFRGIVQPTYAYEGGGKQLQDLGIIFSNGLTGPKARLKLLISLENTTDHHVIQEIFENES